MVEVGCDITAVTSTTGVPVCYSFDQYEDQGQDGAPDAMSSVSLTPVSNTATTTTTSDSSSTTSGSDSGGGGGGGSDPTSTTSTSTPTATAVLIIALGDDASSLDPNEYNFYNTKPGETTNVCNSDGRVSAPDDLSTANPTYPDGTLDIPVDVDGMSDCTYTGTSDSPGELKCPDLDDPVDCQGYMDDDAPLECGGVTSPTEYWPLVICALT
jgi:hypothetical protein